jgi:hypothetical protein
MTGYTHGPKTNQQIQYYWSNIRPTSWPANNSRTRRQPKYGLRSFG